MANCSATLEEPPVCCPGGTGGTFIYGDRALPSTWPLWLNATLYTLLLIYFFLGVAIVADIFMAAIEAVTSVKKTVKRQVEGKIHIYRVSVWNATVANLTLMALGSSAPEILLSMIELVFSNGFKSGELGPSTIVGSAAFNLQVIIAVCVIAIPKSDTRRIEQMRVYMVTAFFSIFAYVWLIVILLWSSPNMIEPWEAWVTLLFFPLLVYLAFVMDKSSDITWLTRNPLTHAMIKCVLPERPEGELPSSFLLDVKHSDGSPLTGEELTELVRKLGPGLRAKGLSEAEATKVIMKKLNIQKPKSRAFYRIDANRRMMGAQPLIEDEPSAPMQDIELASAVDADALCTLQFASTSYAEPESCRFVTISVVREGDASLPISVAYETVEGTASAGNDFVAKSERIEFQPGQTSVEIQIEIIDDDIEEEDEQFSVRLFEPSGGAVLGTISTTQVTIINDDLPGTFVFAEEEISAVSTKGEVTVRVDRIEGCSGHVSLSWQTQDGSAVAGEDFVGSAGRLSWEHGDVSPRLITIPFLAMVKQNIFFDVEISGAEGGALFDAKSDGSSERSLARIKIVDDQHTNTIMTRALESLDDFGMSGRALATGHEDWKAQLVEALRVGTDSDSSTGEKVLAWLSLPWKMLFSIIPPTSYCNGWLCFCVSIIAIGLVTAVIGDLASLLGCTINLKKSIVAITFVALGTSVPDTFASKAAALGDPSADAAIGNVTGSNSVNVFLGLGVSWVIGALYWSKVGATPDWMEEYADIVAYYGIKEGQPVGLAVPAGDLAFSVLVFSLTAVVTLCTLYYRRKEYGAELGGQGRWPTFAFFVFLWLLYVLLSTLRAYGFLG